MWLWKREVVQLVGGWNAIDLLELVLLASFGAAPPGARAAG